MRTRPLRHTLIPFALAAILLTGCGPEQDARQQEQADRGNGGNAGQASGSEAASSRASTPENTVRESTVVTGYTPPEEPLSAPEPAVAPPVEEEPAGEVIQLDAEPEGLVADAETGLIAVGIRDPKGLALVDAESGEVVRTTEQLPGAPRHLGLAGPGGPVLVPAEGADTLFQIGLPDGEIVEETRVGDLPHHADGAPGGRVFVINEKASTASVIEAGEVVETFETPMNPGGVTVTEGGLLGIVGVKGLALEVFEADTLESLGRVDAGEGPTHVQAGPDERFYVADTRGDAVLVYRPRPEPGRIARVPLPDGSPYGLDVDPEREHLWVTLTGQNRLVHYDISGDAPREISRYPTVRQPNDVAVNPADGRVFVAGRANSELQVIDPGSEGS